MHRNTIEKTVLITGCSSGIGCATALRFAREGWQVVATMRDPAVAGELSKLPNVLLTALDVTDANSIRAAVELTLTRFGRIDALVNNAGFGLFGPFEPASKEIIARQFNTNVFGLFDVTRAVLPTMRAQGEGVILNVASIGGLTTLPFNSIYHAAKYAVVGFTEALNHELAEFGVRAKFVAPGGVATDFAGRSLSVTFSDDNHPYAANVGKALAAWDSRRGNYAAPEQVADVIYHAVTDGSQQIRYLSGADAEMLYHARRTMNDAEYLQQMRTHFGLAG